jgi:hypothetical protein
MQSLHQIHLQEVASLRQQIETNPLLSECQARLKLAEATKIQGGLVQALHHVSDLLAKCLQND